METKKKDMARLGEVIPESWRDFLLSNDECREGLRRLLESILTERIREVYSK